MARDPFLYPGDRFNQDNNPPTMNNKENTSFYDEENLKNIDRDVKFYQMMPWPTIAKLSRENIEVKNLTDVLAKSAKKYKKTVSGFESWNKSRPMGGGAEEIQGWQMQMKDCDQERRDAHHELIDVYNDLIEYINQNIEDINPRRTLEKTQQDRSNIAKWIDSLEESL